MSGIVRARWLTTMNLTVMAAVVIAGHQPVARRSLDVSVLKPVHRYQALAETLGADHSSSPVAPHWANGSTCRNSELPTGRVQMLLQARHSYSLRSPRVTNSSVSSDPQAGHRWPCITAASHENRLCRRNGGTATCAAWRRTDTSSNYPDLSIYCQVST